MDMTLSDIDAEVQRQADELTPELLPRLLERMLKRNSLTTCERHDRLLYPYVRLQILLTKVKRDYFRSGDDHLGNLVQMRFFSVRGQRDQARRVYRETPCTCYVQHR